MFGVQSDANYQRDFEQKSFVPFLIVGVAFVVVFVIGLIIFVNALVGN